MKRVHVTPDLEVVHNGAANQPCYFSRFSKKLSEMTSNLSARHKSTGTQYIIRANQFPFMFFKSRALSTQLHRFTREEHRDRTVIRNVKQKKATVGSAAALQIYDAASTDSFLLPHYSGAIKSSGTLCSNLSLLFRKCVTVNRGVFK